MGQKKTEREKEEANRLEPKTPFSLTLKVVLVRPLQTAPEERVLRNGLRAFTLRAVFMAQTDPRVKVVLLLWQLR